MTCGDSSAKTKEVRNGKNKEEFYCDSACVFWLK